MQSEINKLEIDMATIKNDLNYIKQSLEDNKAEHLEIIAQIKSWKKETEKKYVRKADFAVVRLIVFGLVAIILTMAVRLILTNSLHL